MTAIVTLDELKAGLDWTLDADEERDAQDALEQLSDWARYYGRNWDATNSPRIVKTVIKAAAKRYLRNPDGYTQSRAGDETLNWSDRGDNAGTANFSKSEIAAIVGLTKRGGIYSMNIQAYGTKLRQPTDGLVPDEGSNEPIQMFTDATEPW